MWYFDKMFVGSLVICVVLDIEVILEVFFFGMIDILGDLFMLVVIVMLMVVINWKFIVFILFFILLLIIVICIFVCVICKLFDLEWI